ncbi:SDR family NAD(P)-dependent oxidoreductase [Deltaproteobacteria bacterium TL4]
MASKSKTTKMNSRLQETPIAVVGMASVFPQSKNLKEYWDNIIRGINCITDVPPSRWNIDDYYDPDPNVPDKTYCKRGGFIPDIDFNPMEFGLPPNILEVTDVSQLLALGVAKSVLDDAGYGNPETYDRDRIGITLGIGGGQKLITPLTTRLQYPVLDKVLKSVGIVAQDRIKIIDKFKNGFIRWEENSFPGMLGNVIAGRIANRLDLGGINCVLDAACAASLAAIKMAVSELLEYRSDMMISGGVDTDNSIFMYMSFSKTPAFTTNENIEPFDENSKGMMVGEGLGMILLKRLEDAEREQDHIYAVIRGIGDSSDGKFKSIYAPRPSGQAKALTRAYADAGFEPASVGLIEAHGTGTAAGDLAEFQGLNEVFGKDNAQKQHIALGTVKSQIGHTKATAGTAGFIKTALALHHKVLPPTINIKNPNPKLEIENTPFYLNTVSRPWLREEGAPPRRAGVSAFGFGGTNFHFVLEEYEKASTEKYRMHTVPQTFIFSATAPEKLITRCEDVLKRLESDEGTIHYQEYAHAAKTAQIPQTEARIGWVAGSLENAVELLQAGIKKLYSQKDAESWDLPQGIYYRRQGMETQGKIAALFSGQGSQYVEMGKELALNFPVMRDVFSKIDQLFTKDGRSALSSKVYPVPVFNQEAKNAQQEDLQQTEYAQPAIGMMSMGLLNALKVAGFQPDFAAGHSFGELTALWAGGVLSDEDYQILAKARGKAMAAPDEPDFEAGTMLAVVGKVENLAKDLEPYPQVVIANFNSKKQVVVAGSKADIAAVHQALQKNYNVVALPVSAAFHTPLVGHAQKPFAQAIQKAKFQSPKIPVYSNSLAKPYPEDPREIQKRLQSHILESVKFDEEIERMFEAGAQIFIEFGPKNILTKLVDSILEDQPHVAIALNSNAKKDSDLQLRQAVAQLKVLGVPLGDIDPYDAEIPVLISKPSSVNVKLNGANYVSPQTKKAFNDSLTAGDPLTLPQSAKIEAPMAAVQTVQPSGPSVIKQTAVAAPKPVALQATPPEKTLKPESSSLQPLENMKKTTGTPSVPTQVSDPVYQGANQQLIESIDQSITQFYKLQEETLKVHQQYLDVPKEYSKTFSQLMQQQISLLNTHPNLEFPESIDRSMTMYHQHQGDTLKMHEQYLRNQSEHSKTVLEFVTRQYSQFSTTVGVTPQAQAPKVIQTPQPQVPQITQQAAPIPSPEPRVETKAKVEVPKAETPKPKATPHKIVPAPLVKPTVPVAVAPSVSFERLTQAMLSVVSEKTGYPTEMLELNMDMEADLGIDSIKRVEILGTVQDQFSELPEINPEDLAELRTLGQIVDRMTSFLQSPVSAPSTSTSAKPVAAPVAVVSGPSVETLTQAMLTVVSEKTGYPTEMLELGMDMEADLGIDSIKRVEILGTVQDQFPELPEINPEDLAELRTLGQIVDRMTRSLPAVTPATSAPVAVPAASGLSVQVLTKAMLTVVSEKTGYPTEMLELGMDMEADLGIDSIKRVEILGTVQDQFPKLPEINPEDLTELRTLGQIVDRMTRDIQAVPSAPSATLIPVASVEVVAPASHVNIQSITKVMLSVVSDKTGYPVEMLELGMDLEADLGIDSIKRVEILGTVQDQFPKLPEIKPEELAELRTLGQIIEYLGASTGAASVEVALPLVSEKTVSLTGGAPRSIARLKFIPAPDELQVTWPEGSVCLITDDGTSTTTELAKAIYEKTRKVVVLSYPQAVVPKQLKLLKEIPRVVLEDLSEEHLRETLKTLIAAHGEIGTLIHLQPTAKSSYKGKLLFDEKSSQVLQHVFLMAKHLQPSLTKTSPEGRRMFMTVAQLDGALGYGNGEYSVVDGGLFGLTKTINLEWHSVFCRALDLSSELSTKKMVSCILAEMTDVDTRLVEVGYGLQGRSTLITESVDDRAVVQPGDHIDSSSVFLVSGGAKGVTANCVIKLAEKHHCKFILLGRSQYSEQDPAWALNCTDDASLQKQAMAELKAQEDKPTPVKIKEFLAPIHSNRMIRATLNAIRQVGGTVEYLGVDVTDGEALQKALLPLAETLGEITGIIHGAGVLADKVIEKKTLQDYNSVYSTKIKGLESLLNAVNSKKLKQLIFFSSASGFFGNAAQSDYALANDILNKTALLYKQTHPQCHVISFNWGPWDGGMVTPELKRMFEQRNVSVIPLDAGAELFVQETSSANNEHPQLLVGSTMLPDPDKPDPKLKKNRLTRKLTIDANPFLKDHLIGGNEVLPTVCVTAWMANTCEQLYPGYTYFSCADYKMLKGIVFDQTLASEYTMDLRELNKSEAEIEFEIYIWHQQQNKQAYNYSARIKLLKKLPPAPVYQNFDKTEKEPVAGSVFYENGTLFHGPRFKAIKRILNISPEKLTMECIALDISEQDQGQFPVQTFHPYASDVQFQGMLIWVRQYHQAGSLPSRAKKGEQYRPITPGQTIYVSLDIKRSSSTIMVADIIVHDENGLMYSQVLNAEVTVSKQLNALFVAA